MFGGGEDLDPGADGGDVAVKQRPSMTVSRPRSKRASRKEKAGILVHEQFGADILRDAAARGWARSPTPSRRAT